ncbi:MAG: c-type cytochrome [Rhizobiaceae bacterium]|nr:c-type cytochrome [Rhizobiaceae bacterium]
MNIKPAPFTLAIVISLGVGIAFAQEKSTVSDQMTRSGFVLENGLAIPAFDPVKGRELFASKGCVVCHSINGIGGEDAPEFSAELMKKPMNAFDFAAGMWRGAGAMIAMQEDEMGGQIEISGDDLANIIAFVHDEKEQKKFSKADIPHEIDELMHGNPEHGAKPEKETHEG